MSEFKIIDRPDGNYRQRTAEVQAVLDTIDTGKAVCVYLNGRKHDSIYAMLYNAAKRKDNSLKLKTKKMDDAHQAYWLEREP